MLRNILRPVALLACSLLILTAQPVAADDEDKAALSGVWERKGGDLKIEFADKDVLKIAPHGDKAMFVIVCSYTVDKQGLVKVKLTDLEGKEELKQKAKDALPIGLKFSFKWQVKNDTATLDDVKGDNADRLKSHLEGDYEKK
jgi:hypothetical protein